MANEEPRYLAIARVLTSWGVRGVVRAEILTDFPDRFKTLKRAYFEGDETPVKIEWARMHGKHVLIKLAGVSTPEDVIPFRNRIMVVRREDAVALPEDTYFWHQIEGLEVYTADGRLLGVVVEVLPTGSNDVYVVRPAGQPRSKNGANEVLVPSIGSVVQHVDLAQGRMIITPLPGMLPGENEPDPQDDGEIQ